jgi:predicted nucleotidyltransferase
MGIWCGDMGERQISYGEALFSGTRQKVLALFFGQPDRSYTQAELIELANAGSGAVQREVERLTNSGLLTVTKIGRQKFYSPNQQAPIYPELCALVRKTLGIEQQLRAAIDQGGENILMALLYGSVAKEEDRANSDIDVLLVSDTMTLEGVFRLFEPAEKALGRTINPTLYTVQEFEKRRADGQPFLRKVLAGKTILLKGSSDGRLG